MDEPESVRHVAIGILSVLSISGTIGNALVLYVFSRQKQKLSSTIFILTLAGTDFITSLVTMPFTITMELLNYFIASDVLCKLFHLLVTTTIPFSAFVMVAIAVDRYLCIVHPFKHTMTIKRAKITVVLLALLAFTLGLLSCLFYGLHQKIYLSPSYRHILMQQNYTHEIEPLANTTMSTSSIDLSPKANSELNETLERMFHPPNEIVHITDTGKCHRNEMIFSSEFFNIFQKISSAFFAVCAIIVIVLYAIIYHSVLTRRRRRLHLANNCCGFLIQTGALENDHEQTEFTILNNVTKDKSPTSASGSKKFTEESFKDEQNSQEIGNKSDKNGNAASTGGASAAADKDALVRPSGVSRAKLEKLRMANIKTALMLSIVALTYIVAFMPAWLMALRVIPMNVIVFYLYFTYNIANPIIYAFLNQSFRNHLQALFKCGR